MTEKGIDQLRADLAAVDADCAEQIRKTMHENYHHFIQACQVSQICCSFCSSSCCPEACHGVGVSIDRIAPVLMLL